MRRTRRVRVAAVPLCARLPACQPASQPARLPASLAAESAACATGSTPSDCLLRCQCARARCRPPINVTQPATRQRRRRTRSASVCPQAHNPLLVAPNRTGAPDCANSLVPPQRNTAARPARTPRFAAGPTRPWTALALLPPELATARKASVARRRRRRRRSLARCAPTSQPARTATLDAGSDDDDDCVVGGEKAPVATLQRYWRRPNKQSAAISAHLNALDRSSPPPATPAALCVRVRVRPRLADRLHVPVRLCVRLRRLHTPAAVSPAKLGPASSRRRTRPSSN